MNRLIGMLAGLCSVGLLAAPLNASAQADAQPVEIQTDAPASRTPLEAALHAPDWLSLSGEFRARYETLDGQFRANGSGGDQLLLFRTLLHAEADAGAAVFGLELQDSRTYLGDSGTPLSSSITNPLDILQAYVRLDGPALLGEGSRSRLIMGRQTIEIGSSRQIDRISFANVIKSYTGAYLRADAARGDELHLLLVAPVGQYPTDRTGLEDNDLSGDEEQWGRLFWGVHFRRADIAPTALPGLWAEAYVYGLNEDDTSAVATPDRNYITPGLRLYRKPRPAQWDVDLELAWRTGTRRETSSPDDKRDLDVDAGMIYAQLGRTFDAPWRPRLSAHWYWTSGDRNPNDDAYNQYERLFGSRRSDLNNTSIHGPLTPANLNAPGMRIDVRPGERWQARLAWSAPRLASDTDSWIVAKRRDPTGRSGDFIGHTLDSRALYQLVPGMVELELGASVLFFGEFAKDAPGATGEDRTLFGYASLAFDF